MELAKRSNFNFNITHCFNLILTAAFLMMWILSYDFYTSVGIDSDRVDGDQVLSRYYRVRWPGNGSFWLGGGAEYHRRFDGPVEEFDLAGSFFYTPHRRPEPRSFWNRIGFWWIKGTNNPCRYCGQVWVGVPSWLPIIFTGVWPLRWWFQRRRSRSTLKKSNLVEMVHL